MNDTCEAVINRCTPKKQTKWNCSEGQSSYALTNAQNFNVCRINMEERKGNAPERRADYLFLTCRAPDDTQKIALIIELKGRHVAHGCSQIITTLLTARKILSPYFVLARLVPRRVPNAEQNSVERNRLHTFLRNHNKAWLQKKI